MSGSTTAVTLGCIIPTNQADRVQQYLVYSLVAIKNTGYFVAKRNIGIILIFVETLGLL